MRCEACGAENPADHRFCNACGKPLSAGPVPAGIPAPSSGTGPAPRATGGLGIVLLLFAGGLILLAACAVVGFAVLSPLLEGSTPPAYDPGPFTPVEPQVMRTSQESSTVTAEPVTGSWEDNSAGLHLQVDPDGTVTLEDMASKEYSLGTWEKLSDGKYRFRSSAGDTNLILVLDPLAGTLHSDDYSMVFIRRTDG